MDRLRSAIRADCTRLVEAFASNANLDFINFCKEWKRMHFQHIYSGLMHDHEIVQMTEELIYVIKRLLLSQRPTFERVGALYLLYTIYYKQPTREYCKIKMNVNDWKKLKQFIQFIEHLTAEKQPQYIFYKLISSHAFRFVVYDVDYGLEDFYNRDRTATKTGNENTFRIRDILKTDLIEITHPKHGLLTAFGVLEDGYNEMKELMNSTEYQNTGGKLEFTSISKDLKNDIAELENIFKNQDEYEEESDDCQSESTKSIRRRRAKLKSKAFTKKKNSTASKSDEYDISLAGDFIKVTKNLGYKKVRKQQKATDIFSEELPEETLNELRLNEPENNKNTGKGAKDVPLLIDITNE